MAKKKKEVKSVSYDLNMRVTIMAELPQNIAYWCCPGMQTDGLKPGKFQSYIWADNTGFKLPEKLTLRLDYPFDEEYTEVLDLARKTKWTKPNGEVVEENFRADSVGEIVWMAAQAYRRAFKWAKEKNIGYWHGIGDLVFEGMTIYEDGTVEFSVGS